jgi:hypothetical protein
MEKLYKIEINPEFLLTNEELLHLKGGALDREIAECRKYFYDTIITIGTICCDNCTSSNAEIECRKKYPDTSLARCINLACNPE